MYKGNPQILHQAQIVRRSSRRKSRHVCGSACQAYLRRATVNALLRQAWFTKGVLDCSGDGRVGGWAGGMTGTCPRITPVVILLGSNTSFHVGYLCGAYNREALRFFVSGGAAVRYSAVLFVLQCAFIVCGQRYLRRLYCRLISKVTFLIKSLIPFLGFFLLVLAMIDYITATIDDPCGVVFVFFTTVVFPPKFD